MNVIFAWLYDEPIEAPLTLEPLVVVSRHPVPEIKIAPIFEPPEIAASIVPEIAGAQAFWLILVLYEVLTRS